MVPQIAESTGNRALDYLRGATYFVDMPDDYLHLLNCICLFDVNKNKECWNAGDVMVVGATKLTADSWSSVVDDVYNRPTKKRPYYYIHNQNNVSTTNGELENNLNVLPTNVETDTLHDMSKYIWSQLMDKARQAYISDGATKDSVFKAVTDANTDHDYINDVNTILTKLKADSKITNAKQAYEALIKVKAFEGTSNFSRTFDFVVNDKIESMDAIEKPAGSRHANSSRVKVEIRCGRDKSNVFSLSAVQIDYVKAPQFIRLTQEQLDSDEDISQVMEFPDYVNQEIVNELVNLVMRKINDPSLQAHM